MKIADSIQGRRRLMLGLLAAALIAIALPVAWLHSRSHPEHDCLIRLGLGDSRADLTTRGSCDVAASAIHRAGWESRSLPTTASTKGFQVSCRLRYEKNGDTLTVYRRNSDPIGYEFCRNEVTNGWKVDYFPPYTL